MRERGNDKMSELQGRFYALNKKLEITNQTVFDKIDSARFDIKDFLEKNPELQNIDLLKQAKYQLDFLAGFLTALQ